MHEIAVILLVCWLGLAVAPFAISIITAVFAVVFWPFYWLNKWCVGEDDPKR